MKNSLCYTPGSGCGAASRHAQGGQAAPATDESSEEDDSVGHLSDDEDILWKQTWYGGTIARDGLPSGSAGRDPLSDDDDEELEGNREASQTSSPAAAASRRSVPRMPLQHNSQADFSHREKY
eukprot:5449944-Pyramimonas_sp.AAC.1